MKALKRLVIGSSASMLTDKQMKGLKGGGDDNDPYGDGPWYCHCNNESGSIYVSYCDLCAYACSHSLPYSCDHDGRGL